MRNQLQVKFSLPEDLIIEILLRLPLESLLACKGVSKQWNNLVNNPRFVQLYRNKSTFLFLNKGNLYFLSLSENDHEHSKMKPRRVPMDRLFNRDTNIHSLLLESSNKRACVKTTNGDFLVFDLLTGKSYKVIPEIASQEPTTLYGFTYDCYANDYYIVLFSSTQVFVYSFRDGGWKSFPDATSDYDDDDFFHWGVYHDSRLAAYCFNGNLHWVVVSADHHRQVVAAFDLHSGRFTEIALPGSNAAYNYDPSPTLAEFDGHLCCCDYGSFGFFDVWVMKEYGVEESWTKLLSIDDHKYLRLRSTTPPFEFFEWTTPPALYSRDGGGKVAICLGHDSTLRVFEYELCRDEVRMLHSTTWAMDKIISNPHRSGSRTRNLLWVMTTVVVLKLALDLGVVIYYWPSFTSLSMALALITFFYTLLY